jgi:hypothetical protein
MPPVFAASRNISTQSRCPPVSGTLTPRGLPMRSKAIPGAKPKSTSTQAAMSDQRPIPALQCTATAFPSFRRVTIASASGHATVRERESTELHINVMAKSGFPIKAEFPDLLGSRRLTMTPIPSALQPAISSSSQSPARGCCMIAKRAPAGRSIQ